MTIRAGNGCDMMYSAVHVPTWLRTISGGVGISYQPCTRLTRFSKCGQGYAQMHGSYTALYMVSFKCQHLRQCWLLLVYSFAVSRSLFWRHCSTSSAHLLHPTLTTNKRFHDIISVVPSPGSIDSLALGKRKIMLDGDLTLASPLLTALVLFRGGGWNPIGACLYWLPASFLTT